MGWLIALGILTQIAIIPVGVSAIYDADGPRVYATVAMMRISLFPTRKKDSKPKKEEKKKQSNAKSATQPKSATPNGGNFHDFLPVVDTVLDLVAAFGRKLRITDLQMNLILAGDDPYDLAQNYGKAWAALGNVFSLLNNAFIIKKRDLQVQCDFVADKTTITARADLSITVGRVISLTLVRGIPVLRELLKILNKRKGGAKA